MWHFHARGISLQFWFCNCPLVLADNGIFLWCLNKFSCFQRQLKRMTGLVSFWSMLENHQNPVNSAIISKHCTGKLFIYLNIKKDLIREAFGNVHIIYRAESQYTFTENFIYWVRDKSMSKDWFIFWRKLCLS